MIYLGKDREIFNNVVVYRNFFRKLWYITYMRSYLDIILTYSSLFLPTFFNARLFVTTSWLRIYSWWVSKSHPRKRKTKENRQTMDFGVSAFSIDLAIVWILNFCVFLCVSFLGVFLLVHLWRSQTNKTPFRADFLSMTSWRRKDARWKRREIEKNESCCGSCCVEQPTNLSAVCQAFAAGSFNFHLIFPPPKPPLPTGNGTGSLNSCYHYPST